MTKAKCVFYFLMCLVIFITSCVNAQQKKLVQNNDLKNYGLIGKVKTLKFSDYNTTERYGEYQKGDIINSYFIVLDEKGNIIEKQEYNRDGSLFDKYIYQYNNQNNKYEEDRYDSNGKLFNIISYKYDSNNNLIEEIENESLKGKGIEHTTLNENRFLNKNYAIDYGSFYSKNIYKYDDRDNMIEDKSYIEGANGKDTICTSTFYKYDEKGNQLEYNFVAKITNTSNFANTKQNNKYDNNNKTETTFQDCVSNSTGIVHCNSNGKDTYKYDGNNKMVEEIDYKSDGSIRGKYIYKYNSEGVQIEKNTYHADNSKTTSKYNKDGKLIEETEYNSNNIQTSTIKYFTIYDYDSNGNWIKETDSKNDIPQEITEREIIYY